MSLYRFPGHFYRLRELGVSVSLLEIWRRKYGSETPKAKASPISLEDEIRRLRRENASLHEEKRDIVVIGRRRDGRRERLNVDAEPLEHNSRKPSTE